VGVERLAGMLLPQATYNVSVHADIFYCMGFLLREGRCIMVTERERAGEGVRSPSDFISRVYGRYFTYASSLPSREVQSLFNLSSGINSFPMTKAWKDLLKIELDHDFLYKHYTNSDGIPFITRSALLSETFMTTEGSINLSHSFGKVYMTMGAAQAVAIVFDFVSSCRSNASVLILGLNFPMFELLARRYKMTILESINQDEHTARTLPTAEAVAQVIAEYTPDILVITQPNNPSGEVYTQAELETILLAAKRSQTLILADLVGWLPVSLDPWVNMNKIIVHTQVQAQTVLIHSFSKTDSSPGFRLGYMVVPPEMDTYVSKYQYATIMNPQTFPLLPLFLSFLVRSLFTGLRMQWVNEEQYTRFIQIFSRFFKVNNLTAHRQIHEALSPEQMQVFYDEYVREQMMNYRSIQNNYVYFLETMEKYIARHTEKQGGFNFLVEFLPLAKKDETEVCEVFLNDLHLAIFPEACFRIYRSQKKNNFWIRVTLAYPEDDFCMAIGRLKRYFDQQSTC
jgi:aspartate/methionine/tyrosine aminotransferase